MRRILFSLGLFCIWSATLYAEPLTVSITGTVERFAAPNSQGDLHGFNVDIVNEICRRLQRECLLQVRRFPAVLPEIESGGADIGVANHLKTPERAARVAFSIPYWRSTSSFVAPLSLSPNDMDLTLANQPICVIKGTRQQAYLQQVHHVDSQRLITTTSTKELEEKVVNGACRIALLPTLQILTFLQSEPGSRFTFYGPSIDSNGLGGNVHIIVRPDRPQLLKQVNEALSQMIADGTHERITQRYFPFSIR
ncbi:substrate-binding periplasmic protein [Sedimenticola sp.]|uniref:substrate-binding periplasmic protein n=1 Tax=Sedimenticola sp. TaxID=1940285 RepID=UPI003D13D962